MIRSIYSRATRKLPVLKEADYFAQYLHNQFFNRYQGNDEWGKCINCGRFARFRYYQFLNKDSKVVQSCGWDELFTEVIHITNTLECSWCSSKFRVRCAAKSLLDFLRKGEITSVKQLVHHLEQSKPGWLLLETGSKDGVFSDYSSLSNVIKSEYFDDVPRGAYKDGIRSEDLQQLTFSSNTFDAVISLDVFEHIADPWKAFSEVERVLKPNGVGIITVPIDLRNHTTKTLAESLNGEIQYYTKPAYHLDHLRAEGVLVFTEFGTDIQAKLEAMGHNVLVERYAAARTNTVQIVILIKKA